MSASTLTGCLKSVISSCTNLTKSTDDSHCRTVQRNVEGLYNQIKQDPNQLKLMSDDNLLASECIMSIISTLSKSGQVDVTQSIIRLLQLMSSEPIVKEQLLSYGLIDTLVEVLSQDENKSAILTVLQALTYQQKFTGHEPFLDRLLPIAVPIILNKESSLRQAVGVLVNLCSDNVVIKQHVRALDRTSSLRRAIRSLIGHDDNEVVIVALAAMCTTGMSDEITKMVSNEKNLDQILKLPFSIILTLRKKESFNYAIDVLKSLVKIKKVQTFLLSNCSHSESFLSKVSMLLTKCSHVQLPKLFELLMALSDVAGLRRLLTMIVFAPVKISQEQNESELITYIFHLCTQSVTNDNGTSVKALKFIISIYEAMIVEPTLAGSTCHLNFQYLTECLKQNELDSKRKELSCQSAEKLNTALQLLEVLCSTEKYRPAVLSEVESSTITDIIDYQLRNNSVCIKVGMSNAPDTKNQPWGVTGVEIVLRSLNVLMKATEHHNSYETCLEDYLQRSILIPFVAAGLTSPITEQVLLSLKITKVHMFPLAVLADVISGLCQKNTSPAMRTPIDRAESPRIATEKKEWTSPDEIPGSPPDCNISERLTSMHLTDDSHTSDIIAIYEQKLRAQKTKENHLDDLVQAKAMALAQADRLIQQYKSRLSQTDSETQKLRSIVLESERRSENYREKMNEMLLDQQRLQQEMEKYLEDAQRLENAQRTLASLKDEHKALKDMHSTLTTYTENLKQQHHELETEYDLLKETDRKKSLTIKEQEAKLTDINKIKNKLEEQGRKLSQDKAELSDQVTKLKEDKEFLQKTVKSKDEKLKIISELTSGAK